jgi:type II restriction/modification system DNA methylase subunit YeeA
MTRASRLPENAGCAFEGDKKGGAFEIASDIATLLLSSPNPDGRSNADVVRRWINSSDVQGRSAGMWIIDFGVGMSEPEAALYEAPFEYVREHIRPERLKNNRQSYVRTWWQHVEPRPGMRAALANVSRFIATTRHSKFRLFTWQDPAGLPDSALAVIARDDDYTFGVVQSRAHELWARATGTQVREAASGFRYTPTTCFETFPFPDPTPEQRERVGEAARRLVELRDGWLNPPGLDPADLAKRTLTNLYNQCPTWLANAHADLDAAVLAAYGWPPSLSDAEILERLLAVNLARAAGDSACNLTTVRRLS